MPHATRSLLLAAPVVWLSLIGCGEPADPVTDEAAALATGQSFLVSFSNGGIPANADALVKAAGGTIAARYPNVGAVLARSTSASFTTSLRLSTGIAAVGAVKSVSSKLAPVASLGGGHAPMMPPKAAGDPLSFRQWDMDQIRAPAARAVTPGSKSVLVGFVDSGVDITHPDLVGQVNAAASASCLGGIADPSPAIWANDVIGHGTFTTGLVAAKKNGIGTIGVAPGVHTAMVKVVLDDLNDPDTFGLIFPDAFVCGIEWGIAHGFDLINSSLSIDPFTGPVDDIFCTNDPDRAAVIQIVRQAINAAARKKLTVVAASGNSFIDLANLPGSAPGVKCDMLPIQAPKVIGVSAVGVTRQLSFYSNYGAGAIDVTGPGGDALIPDPLVTDTTASGQVLSTISANSLFYQQAAYWNGQLQDCSSGICATYAYLQGTSFAAPHVTGVAALIISRFGKMQPDALAARLQNAATPLACPPSPYNPGDMPQPATCKGPPNHNNFYGSGEIDALASIR